MIELTAYYPRSRGGGNGCDFRAFAADKAAAVKIAEEQAAQGAALVALDGTVCYREGGALPGDEILVADPVRETSEEQEAA